MTKTMRRGGLCTVIGLLALTTACGTAAKPAPPAHTTTTQPATTAPAVNAGKPSDVALPGITADKLPAYQKVADCLRQQGVQITDPKVGQPWDNTPMNDLFST